jgi:segregation and condensation protein B
LDAAAHLPAHLSDDEPRLKPAMKLKDIVEAALSVAQKPLTVAELLNLFPEDEQPETTEVRGVLAKLAEEYKDRPIELKQVASGYRFQVREGLSPWISRLFEERPTRYTKAFLETLAIIAYRQPVTRGEIEEIRGVAVSTQIIRNLIERDWVQVVGHKEVPGRPGLYATTRQFLDYFNLKGLDELPPLQTFIDRLGPVADTNLPVPATPNIENDPTETPQADKNKPTTAI